MSDIEIPPTPATVGEAIQQANDLAYGFAKHANDGYWDKLYLSDPDYAWKRMLGWQAGPEDAAKFGLWADPPSPWHGSPVPVPVPVPTPEPAPVPDDRLAAIERELAEIKGLIVAVGQKPAPDYKGEGNVRILGPVTFTLKPQ